MKTILTIINILGGVLMMLALAVPFTSNVSEGAQLFFFLYYLIGGFIMWYLTAKKLGGKA